MSTFEEAQLGRDWLSITPFNPEEMSTVLGDGTADRLHRASFNWIATYLIEEVGIYEEELVEWFRSPMRRLDQRTPLETWQEDDGFEQVYGEAKDWAAQVAEDLINEPGADEAMQRKRASEAIADTVTIFRNALLMSGAQLTAEEYAQGGSALWDGKQDNSVVVRWLGSEDTLEGYKVTIPDGQRLKMLTVTLLNYPTGQQEVVQAGIHVMGSERPEDNHIASDWDAWPMRADLEPFVSTVIHSLSSGELQLVQ